MPVRALALTPPRSARTALLAVLALLATVAVLVLRPVAASAASGPLGSVESTTGLSSTKIEVKGWAADVNALTKNVNVLAEVDGNTAASTVTSVARPDIQTKYHTGPTQGFVLDVPVPSDGNKHVVCIAEHKLTSNYDQILKCIITPLGATLTSAETAARSPFGKFWGAGAQSNNTFRMIGWMTDPDYRAKRLFLLVYIDGVHVATEVTDAISTVHPTTDAGPVSMFDFSLSVSAGAHVGCLYATNVGLGSNTFMGCAARDTRAAGTGTVTPPAANAAVVTEAKKHIGQQYVWGAEGPTTFDCSGLVMYSYGKAGITTPRVSQDQFHAAQLISASRAVPGDLVFYHDQYGSVYHVGIYLSPATSSGPALTVAAIDEAEGVNYQKVWDTTATYGSFTHS